MSNPNPKTDHLIPFKKGQSGNPKGAAKGKTLSTILRMMLDREMSITDPIDKTTGKRTIKEILNLQLIAKAIKGDLYAMKEIYNRIEGMPKQEVDYKDMTDDPLMKESIPALKARLQKLLG